MCCASRFFPLISKWRSTKRWRWDVSRSNEAGSDQFLWKRPRTSCHGCLITAIHLPCNLVTQRIGQRWIGQLSGTELPDYNWIKSCSILQLFGVWRRLQGPRHSLDRHLADTTQGGALQQPGWDHQLTNHLGRLGPSQILSEPFDQLEASTKSHVWCWQSTEKWHEYVKWIQYYTEILKIMKNIVPTCTNYQHVPTWDLNKSGRDLDILDPSLILLLLMKAMTSSTKLHQAIHEHKMIVGLGMSHGGVLTIILGVHVSTHLVHQILDSGSSGDMVDQPMRRKME